MRLLVTLAVLTLVSCTCGARTCSQASPCPDGQVCGADGLCVAPTLTTVVVSEPAARGCELLVSEQAGTEVDSARFEGGAKGTLLHEAPRVALVFVATKDAPFQASDVQLALSRGAASGLTVSKSSCVDAAGNRLPNATVSFR